MHQRKANWEIVSQNEGLEREGSEVPILDVIFLGTSPHQSAQDPLVGCWGDWPTRIQSEFSLAQVWTLFPSVNADRKDIAALQGLLTEAGVGERQIVFITHSLLGVVLKSFLKSLVNDHSQTSTSLLQSTRAIVFLSTPHRSASKVWRDPLLKQANELGLDFCLRDPVVVEELNRWFVTYLEQSELDCLSFIEGLSVPGYPLLRRGDQSGIGGDFSEVPETDHFSICQCSTKGSSRMHDQTVAFVKDRIVAATGELERSVVEEHVAMSSSSSVDLPTTASVDKDAQQGFEVAGQLGLSKTVPPIQFLATKTIDGKSYEIVERIGQGGMGTVYLVKHSMLETKSAMKIINIGPSEAHKADRFLEEMKVAARLKHRHLVAAHDAGKWDLNKNSYFYLIMDYLPGLDLDALIRRRRTGLTPMDACELVRQAALGLQHVHDNELVHRDIKPSNLMLTLDENGDVCVKILDFGLVRSSGNVSGLTKNAGIMGTPLFMAPEQAMAPKDVDWRADVYSLGATFFALLTGQPPLEFPNQENVALVLKETPIPSIADKIPDLEPGIVQLVNSMLAKTPENRTLSASKIAEELSSFAQGHQLSQFLP